MNLLRLKPRYKNLQNLWVTHTIGKLSRCLCKRLQGKDLQYCLNILQKRYLQLNWMPVCRHILLAATIYKFVLKKVKLLMRKIRLQSLQLRRLMRPMSLLKVPTCC